MATKEEYERAITAAELDPGNLSENNKKLLRNLLREPGRRGDAARKALGND